MKIIEHKTKVFGQECKIDLMHFDKSDGKEWKKIFDVWKELKLGLPDEEESVFEKLRDEDIVSEETFQKLRAMKKFRNVLIHRYKQINNSLVFRNAVDNKNDFIVFKNEVLSFLKKKR